jgi:hypothetical protein
MTMTLVGDAGSRTLRGNVPSGFEKAFKALSDNRWDTNEDDLEDTRLEVVLNPDGKFTVTETRQVKVVTWNTVSSTETLHLND